MNRRIWLPLALVIAAAVAVTTGLAGSAAGANGGAFKNAIPANFKGFKVTNMPLGASNKPMGFIVELSAKPVTVVDAASKAAGKGPLTMTQRSSLVGQIKAAQAPVARAIQNMGGTVTERFQTVYNGMGVRIPARDAFKLANLSGVKAIYRMRTFKRANVNSVPVLNGPETWDGVNGFSGAGIKIGDIDTGLDFTHADFGGPGTTDEWSYALANDTVDPNNNTDYCSPDGGTTPCFGSNAPKVKGGWDFVGDCYDASQGTPYDANGIDCTGADQLAENSDPNPLDCNSHGTHTAGTLAGFGVDGDGNTYSRSYDANTISDNTWTVGPGMAPRASLYAYRVFGCEGSVNDDVLLAAMDMAVADGMDVINMSLGADFGSSSDADSVAATNTARDGVIVVAASGNAGNFPYITSSPAAGTWAISAAANDSNPSYPAATLALTDSSDASQGTLTAQDNNGAELNPGTYNLVVIPGTGDSVSTNTGSGTDSDSISVGCTVGEDESQNDGSPYTPDQNVILVVERGICARVHKAVNAQEAGAMGVIMVNNTSDFPPYEGKITSDPDNTEFSGTVTIPFLGVQGGSPPSGSDEGQALLASNGGTVDLEAAEDNANPNYLKLASFSSWGPSVGGLLKPEVTAPGVSVDSAGMGSGNQALLDSGTSMATPHIAGEAALVKQAHPTWKNVLFYKDAILNTANKLNVTSYSMRGAGSGEGDAYNATHTQVVAGGYPTGMASLNFGVPYMKGDYSKSEYIRLRNFSGSSATFDLADTNHEGQSSRTVAFSINGSSVTSVTVPAHGTASVKVTLSIPLASARDSAASYFSAFLGGTFRRVAGLITLTPEGNDNSSIALTVPYFAVPTSASAVHARINTTKLAKNGNANALISNVSGGAEGYADWFSLGATSPVSDVDQGSADLTDVGVQSWTDWEVGAFALKVTKPWSNPAEDEFDFYVDVNGDGTPDYDVLSAPLAALVPSLPYTTATTFVCPFDESGNLVTADCSFDYFTNAFFNGTTMSLPFDWGQMCLDGYQCITPGQPISYVAFAFDRNGGFDEIGSYDSDSNTMSVDAAPFDLFNPVFSNVSNTGDFSQQTPTTDAVDPGSSITDQITVDPAAWAATPQEGFLALLQNNRGAHNADESVDIPFSLGEDSRHHG